MLEKSTGQNGSVASFIVIALILVVGTVGSIYFVGQRADQARKDEASKVANQPTQAPKDEGTNVATPSTPTTQTEPETTPVVATPESSNGLPTTGIEPDAVRMLAVGLLVGSTMAFVMSRSSLRRSL